VKKDLQQLMQVLGLQFQDENHLRQALTHRSVSSENNERLEFLGDSLLNFIIAGRLFELFPKAREGELSRLRAKLVKGETIAEMGKELELSDYLILSSGELKSGGHERQSILADSFEAVIAAIYLDAGFDVCRERVLAWYQERLADPQLFSELKDPKSLLQEYLQARQLELPIYDITNITGEAHEQVFEIRCTVKDLKIETSSRDTTRRNAEQKAAAKILAKLEQA